MSRPVNPHPVNPARPRPLPAPRPNPPAPRPGRLVDDPAFRTAVAMVLVGVLGLTVHYWAPLLLLAALPTRRWRACA